MRKKYKLKERKVQSKLKETPSIASINSSSIGHPLDRSDIANIITWASTATLHLLEHPTGENGDADLQLLG
jgi:hypothetical protein